MKKHLSVLLILALCLAVLSGCGGSSNSGSSSSAAAPAQTSESAGNTEAAPAGPSVLKIALDGQPEHLAWP